MKRQWKSGRYRSLEHKIKFLRWRGSGIPSPKEGEVWTSFLAATKFRNKLIHPKPGQISYSGLTVSAGKSCLVAILKVAQMLGWAPSIPNRGRLNRRPARERGGLKRGYKVFVSHHRQCLAAWAEPISDLSEKSPRGESASSGAPRLRCVGRM